MWDRRVSVEAVEHLSARYFVLTLKCADIAAAARPGQFVMIGVGTGIDPLLRRPMAFYRVVERAGEATSVALLVERMGRGTELLSQVAVGDQLPLLGPLGVPFDPGAAPAEVEHIMVMGGVGSAPFPLLAAELLGRGGRGRAFIGGRAAGNVLCADDFATLGVPAEIATDDGSLGHHGLVTEPLEAYLDRQTGPARLYSCGPTPMMRAVDRIARARGLHHQVSLEAPMACGIGVCLSCVVRVGDPEDWEYHRICREGPVFDASTLVWGNA